MNHSSPHASAPCQDLQDRISGRTARVGVVGLGYVGLPLAHAAHAAGFPVIGFDVDPGKVEALAEGRTYLKHLGEELASDLTRSDRFDATCDFGRMGEADVILVCVPTPLGAHGEPDLSYVVKTAEAIGRTVRPGQLLVLESTTYPGTTRDEFLPEVLRVAASRSAELTVGEDLFVAYSPEREDPGRKSHSTRTIPKVVGGVDEESTRLAGQLYSCFISEVHVVGSTEVAEASKLLENIFRSVNIALVNELKVILDAMGIDVWEVVEAASTKPFGFMPFYPGPGLGGHCIPIDPFYLSWKAKEVGKPTRFIELAGEINTQMPKYVVERVASALNAVGKAVSRSRILILGLAYKADVDDTRESPSFELIEQLTERGATVDYSDPHIEKTVPVRKHDFALRSVTLTPESLATYDAVVIATAHTAFDYDLIAEHAALIVDTRNAMRGREAQLGDRWVRA